MDTWENIRERILARDEGCNGRFLGGECSATLDVHHILPREEGGADVEENLMVLCHRHHPMLEAIRRAILKRRAPRRVCPHQHRYPGAREACERQLNRAA
jgi:hypothetical protein